MSTLAATHIMHRAETGSLASTTWHPLNNNCSVREWSLHSFSCLQMTSSCNVAQPTRMCRSTRAIPLCICLITITATALCANQRRLTESVYISWTNPNRWIWFLSASRLYFWLCGETYFEQRLLVVREWCLKHTYRVKLKVHYTTSSTSKVHSQQPVNQVQWTV